MYLDRIESSFDLEAIKNSGLNFAYDAMYGAGQNVMKKLFPEMIKTPSIQPIEIAEKNNWTSKNDYNELESIIMAIFNENPDETARFKNGEKKLTGFFMGKIMKASKGTADPKTSAKLINQLINK